MSADSGLSRRAVVAGIATTAASGLIGRTAFASETQGPSGTETVEINVDLHQETGKLDHIWSRCAGSDRAAITLREEWRYDLERFHKETGLERVRFHGIVADELGVWTSGKEPNFQNVDAVYDGLLDRGVQPFVELSFMPRKLASGPTKSLLYGANVTPPSSLSDWADFIGTFVRHLVGRYGIAEVRKWYFEVWNEPNLKYFWSGTQAEYFDLYKATAAAVKAVDPALKVGGPATASAQWISEFLDHCATAGAPVDFVSTHIYAGDDQAPLFGQANKYSQNDVIPAAMAQVRGQIDASCFKGTELWLSEWSSDSPAMIAHVIAGCMPHCQAMSQWTMSNVFEEILIAPWILKEGDNGWGMMARRNIPKPQFNTYKLLHRLGRTRLAATGPAIATRTERGAAILVWNLAEASQPSGIPGTSNVRTVTGTSTLVRVKLHGAQPGQAVTVTYVDQERGSPYPAWRKLGSPQYPTRAQLDEIRKAAELGAPETRHVNAEGELSLELPPEGVALIEFAPGHAFAR